ncbi:MAG: hypothetical protein FWD69_12925 [Polyangiaceae bacterium]|nr:hypothetical protein [Polyangiaceae bacterium]
MQRIDWVHTVKWGARIRVAERREVAATVLWLLPNPDLRSSALGELSMDVVFVGLSLVLFGVAISFVRLCERV